MSLAVAGERRASTSPPDSGAGLPGLAGARREPSFVPALVAGYRADWKPRAPQLLEGEGATRRSQGRGLGRIVPGDRFGAGGSWTVVSYDLKAGRWEAVNRAGKITFYTAKELRAL